MRLTLIVILAGTPTTTLAQGSDAAAGAETPPEAPHATEDPASAEAGDTEATSGADAGGGDAAGQLPSVDQAPPSPPIHTPQDQDSLGRDQDPMVTGADAGQWPEGFRPTEGMGGSEDALIQGGQLPQGTNAVVPIGGSVAPGLVSPDLKIGGYLQAEYFYLEFDSDKYVNSFAPRETELDIEAAYGETGRVVVDLNLVLDDEARTYEGRGLDRQLADRLIEQAFAEWNPDRLTLRLGRMKVPLGYEQLDVIDRVELTRTWLSILATPDLFNGFYGAAALLDELDVYVMLVNGWDVGADDPNKSKTFSGGIPHRLFPRGAGGWLYQGSLDTVIGVEQEGVNDLRWIVDYSAVVQALDFFVVALEIVYGKEEGRGRRRATGRADGTKAAKWYGGQLALQFDGQPLGGYVEPLRASLRGEYLHDHDLILTLPTRGSLPLLTTLVGLSATLRYALVTGLDLGLEYRVDFERGDRKGVSVHRNFKEHPAFPKVWNLSKWFVTQQVTTGLIAHF